MKFTATLLTFLGATSLVSAAPLDISPPTRGPEGLAKRNPVPPGCEWADTTCSFWGTAWCLDSKPQVCYDKCMKKNGCYQYTIPPEPPAVETIDKRDSQAHCGLRNFQCESQAEFAESGTDITEIYHNCMEERGCKPAPSLNIVTTERLTKRWHPHCGAWQSFKCTAHAERPSRWGDEDADVKEEYRACMIDHDCECAIDYPYHCDKDNS
ncbi:hypothetical protein KCU67_g1082, partial [Aureobasidium melanogenum]